MKRFSGVGLFGGLLAAGLLGCATSPMPPSETTIAVVRSYQNQLDARVASGHLTRAQARELFYAKLAEVKPPLPDLPKLMEFRAQVAAQVETKALTPEQAETQLAAHESEMVARWEEMAARYAREQREIQRMRNEYERGYRDQQQMEQTLKGMPRF